MHNVNCLVCGEELHYHKPLKAKCELCNEEFDTEVSCISGHFICDECHAKDARQLIEEHCLKTRSHDPIEIAEELLALPGVKMHGPEHHFIVPAALLAAYYNHKGKAEEKAEKLALARKRSKHVLGGFCGFYGTCGAAMGTGVFISLITEATPLSTNTWKDCNRMTGESLLKIAQYNGPRCCKRDSFISIEQAVDFLKKELGTILPAKAAYCHFSNINNECLGEACKYNEEQIYACSLEHFRNKNKQG